MAKTPSNMIPLGTTAPSFTLPDVVSNKTVSLEQAKSAKATVIIFMCNHCPFVKHILDKLDEVTQLYTKKGLHFIAINSNDASRYPEDSPEKMRVLAHDRQFCFPYLYDETQKIAHAYQAACTPDFYIFDAQLKCVYRGQFDDSRPENGIPVTGQDITQALDQILANKPVNAHQKPSIGCNIKWKSHSTVG